MLHAPRLHDPRRYRASLPVLALVLALAGIVSMSAPSRGDSVLERTWVLIDLAESGAPVAEGREATLEFDSGSRQASGFGGCNRFAVTYESTEGRLSFGRLRSTMMACPDDDASRQEGFFFDALEAVEGYELDGAELRLLDGEGRPLMTLGPRAGRALAGTTWEAIGLADGRGGLASLVAGTRVTARFEGGSLTGSGGCNSYRATYRSGSGSLTIGPTAATRKLCPEPAGVMGQEAALFEALASVSSYSIEGSRLELRTTGGEPAISFRAADID